MPAAHRKEPFMKHKKLFSLAAALLACCLLTAAPLSAAAALPSDIEAQNGKDDYLYLDKNDVYLYIPEGSRSAQAFLTAYSSYSPGFIHWSSSNSNVVKVDGNGVITGLKSGTAVITAEAFFCTDRCTVTVYKEKTSTLNRSSVTLAIQYNNPNPTTQLYLSEVADRDGIRQWRSSNPEIASVDANGTVTARAPGSATIYATTYRGNALTCSVTVQNDVGRITLNQSDLSLETVGGQYALTASVALADPSSVSITWTSSNPAAATVNESGLVTVTGDGEATITATGSNGRSASCRIITGSTAKKQREKEELLDVIDPLGIIELFTD